MNESTGSGVELQFCTRCPLVDACMPAGLTMADLRHLKNVILRQDSLRRGETLFERGDPFQGLIVVRSGCFKTTMLDTEGGEHVQHFHFSGEVMGFDAIYLGRHVSSAIALSEASVCRLSFPEIMRSAEQMPDFQFRLFRLFSHYALRTGCLTGDHTAEQRVAAFLLSISSRLAAPGEFALELELAMSREDIANHLRLASETVSRVLGKFRDEKLIEVKGKQIRLLDLDAVKELAAPLGRLFMGQDGLPVAPI